MAGAAWLVAAAAYAMLLVGGKTSTAAAAAAAAATSQAGEMELSAMGDLLASAGSTVDRLVGVDGALCEPSKDLAFPKLKTRRRVRVNTTTGSTEFFTHDSKEAKDERLLMETIILRNTTWEEWSWHVRRGYSVVVEDMARDWPMQAWACEDFAREFPDGEMKAEYSTSGNGRIKLSDRRWMEVPREARPPGCNTAQCKELSTKPVTGPHGGFRACCCVV